MVAESEFTLSGHEEAAFDSIVSAVMLGKLVVMPARLHGKRVGMICVVSSENDSEAELVPMGVLLGENADLSTLEVERMEWIHDKE